METASQVESKPIPTPNGEPVTVLVPTGSMRDRMLEFLWQRGFRPPEQGVLESLQAETKEARYQERDLGIWQNSRMDIQVLLVERNKIPEELSERMLFQNKPVIGLTNSDIVLASELRALEPLSYGELESLAVYDLPIPSGRNGGTSYWALIAPKSAFSLFEVYPGQPEISVISENPALADFFCTHRIGAITEEISRRVSRIDSIDGKEEMQLKELTQKGEPTVLIGVVESGKSAKKCGLECRPIYTVKAQAILSQILVDENPEFASQIRQTFALAESPSDPFPPI